MPIHALISRGLQGATVLLACSLAAACASGGGGPVQPGPQPPPSAQPVMGPYWDAKLSGTVARPEPASFSAEPTPDQTIRKEVLNEYFDPGFDYMLGEDFPLLSTSLKASTSGLSAVSANDGARVSFRTEEGITTADLFIPQLNIAPSIAFIVPDLVKMNDVLSYVVLGMWAEHTTDAYKNITAFAFGYETPHDLMPKSGTATFRGNVGGTVFKPVDGKIDAAYVRGQSQFSVDFASGAVNGSFTGMKQTGLIASDPGGTGSLMGGNQGTVPWNDVSVTANIAGGTNRFSGTTAASSSPNTVFSLTGSATGSIDGAFYGPFTDNIGAIWSLSDGTGSAIGTVGAQRNP